MVYLGIVLLVLVALAGVVIVALAVASGPVSHLTHRDAAMGRPSGPPTRSGSWTPTPVRARDSRTETVEAEQ